ncbi:hypothetical protein ACHQM5_005814 [Ranunculus cassubicifolius]
MSAEPFNRLVKLVARAFYDDITMKGDTQPKSGRSDNRGMAVVILDALTRRQWVREEDLAKDLKLHTKQLRRTLRFFEEEKLVTRDHRKETAKGAKIYSAAVAATDGHVKEGEEKVKLHTHSYCCLDYAQVYDVVRYRLHRMKKKLKDELDNRNTVQEYLCPNCPNKRYTALDALRLMSINDEYFHCENCDAILVAASDKLAADEMGDGDDNAKTRRLEKLKDIQQKMESDLKPLMEQIARIKDLPPPEFGSLQAWEARASAAARANGDSGANDPKNSQGQGYGGTAMPYLGETKVEVALSGVKEEDTKPDVGATGMKVLPPWMIKQGMQLTDEQRGEANKQEFNDNNSTPIDKKYDDKKSAVHEKKDDKNNIQDEYIKAYYAALLKRQEEEEAAAKRSQDEVPSGNIDLNDSAEGSSGREVGKKSKREDNDSDDDIWEDASTAGGTNGGPKVNDLNVEAEASDGGDDDEIDWEEG